jgi:hypothetical protein
VVAQIVTGLDGMPLAIELAAGRVEAPGLDQLAGMLGDRFAVLGGSDRLAPERHRSLAAAVDCSYQLLGEEQRRVFRLVSVFPGPFTLAAAEAVAGPGAGPAVLHLVDCSLLSPPRPGADGRARYAMLETQRPGGTPRAPGRSRPGAGARQDAGGAGARRGDDAAVGGRVRVAAGRRTR